MGYNEETIQSVASALDDISIMAREMAKQIREGAEEQPYAAVYWLRSQLSREVARLGAGQPNTKRVETYYLSQIRD